MVERLLSSPKTKFTVEEYIFVAEQFIKYYLPKQVKNFKKPVEFNGNKYSTKQELISACDEYIEQHKQQQS